VNEAWPIYTTGDNGRGVQMLREGIAQLAGVWQQRQQEAAQRAALASPALNQMLGTVLNLNAQQGQSMQPGGVHGVADMAAAANLGAGIMAPQINAMMAQNMPAYLRGALATPPVQSPGQGPSGIPPFLARPPEPGAPETRGPVSAPIGNMPSIYMQGTGLPGSTTFTEEMTLTAPRRDMTPRGPMMGQPSVEPRQYFRTPAEWDMARTVLPYVTQAQVTRMQSDSANARANEKVQADVVKTQTRTAVELLKLMDKGLARAQQWDLKVKQLNKMGKGVDKIKIMRDATNDALAAVRHAEQILSTMDGMGGSAAEANSELRNNYDAARQKVEEARARYNSWNAIYSQLLNERMGADDSGVQMEGPPQIRMGTPRTREITVEVTDAQGNTRPGKATLTLPPTIDDKTDLSKLSTEELQQWMATNQ